MALTAAQRRAKIEAAKALMNEVEKDETAETATATTTTQASPGLRDLIANPTIVTNFFPHKPNPAQQATQLPAAALVQAKAVESTAAAAAYPVLPQAIRTPHSDAIAAGKPSLFQMLVSVAKLGFGKTQKG